MSEPFYNTGRVVTADNFFSSIPLVQYLWKNGLMYVGTLRVNKTEIPQEFKPHRKREIFTTNYGYHDYLTLISYVPDKKKAVILLSSKHHIVELDNDQAKKPKIIRYYNKTKGGVDNFDKLIGTYSCRRKCLRWTLRFFMYMIDVYVHNSVTLSQEKRKSQNMKISKTDRRVCIQNLAIDLMSPFIQERVDLLKQTNFRGIQSDLKECFRKAGCNVSTNVEGESEEHDEGSESEEEKAEKVSMNNKKSQRKRCQVCERSNDKKTAITCSKCERSLCYKHSLKFYLCKSCYDEIQARNIRLIRETNDSPSSNLRSNNKN